MTASASEYYIIMMHWQCFQVSPLPVPLQWQRHDSDSRADSERRNPSRSWTHWHSKLESASGLRVEEIDCYLSEKFDHDATATASGSLIGTSSSSCYTCNLNIRQKNSSTSTWPLSWQPTSEADFSGYGRTSTTTTRRPSSASHHSSSSTRRPAPSIY